MVRLGCIFPAVEVISVHSQGPEMKAMVPIPPTNTMQEIPMITIPAAKRPMGLMSMFIIIQWC